MKNICFYFQVHQPYRLKKYRFFNIGKDHFYFDDYLNRIIIERLAQECYLPMNKMILDVINQHKGNVKVAFSITGTVVEQLIQYAPDVIESFKELANTGCVEFIAETYSHSLASLKDTDEFKSQVKRHAKLMEDIFGYKPVTFRNTELIYSDQIGSEIESLGFHTILTEGTKHILGWKSPNYIYSNTIKQRVKLILRNYKLSDDISFRYNTNRPSVEHFYTQLLDQEGDTVNMFMDYETFGEHIKASDGIIDFMKGLFEKIATSDYMKLSTPREVAAVCQSVSLLSVPHPISWADEERDLTAWLGNELQDDAISKLYNLKDYVKNSGNDNLIHVWNALQTSDNFYYMSTKWFAGGNANPKFNPYDSPYEAFMNYMNVYADFALELKK